MYVCITPIYELFTNSKTLLYIKDNYLTMY